MPSISRKVRVATRTAKYMAQDAIVAISSWLGIQKEEEEEPRGDFSLFPLLPVDIRLHIWGMVELEPCIITQHKTGKSKPMFKFPRLIPAVLHTCRESRYEFIEPNDELPKVRWGWWGRKNRNPSQALVSNWKRDHPTYKLFFTGKDQKSISKPVLFSVDIDTLWGSHCLAKKPISFRYVNRRGVTITMTSHYSGLTDMNIASRLEKLTMYVDFNFIGILPYFTNLKELTLLYPSYVYEHRDPIIPFAYGRPILGPEINGEINTFGLPMVFRAYVAHECERVSHFIAQMVLARPEYTPPVIKFRTAEQYAAAEGLGISISVAGWRSFD